MSSPLKFPHLAKPLQIGDVTLSNRMVMSSLTRNRSRPQNTPSDASELYYEQRASAGLLLSEGTLVYQQGTEWPYAPGIWDEDQVQAWKRVTDRVHQQGGKIFCQLWSVGRLAHPDMPEQIAANEPVWAPSTISARGGAFRTLPGTPGYVAATAIPDPRILIERYAQGARNAKAAGFDGIDIHGANGYIIQQFLDTTSNDRRDQWGGSVEKRMRFALDVVDAIAEVWNPGSIGIKLNPAGGYNDMGMPEDETVRTYGALIKALVARKLGYILLVRWAEALDQPVDGKRRGTEIDVWRTFAPLIHGSETKVLLNGGISPEEGESLLASGVGDAIVFGRPLINNPDYYQRIQQGIPVAPPEAMDPRTWYTSHSEPVAKYGNLPDPHIGLTDYPPA